MQIFLDSADINEIKELNRVGIIDGITTNPTLVANSGKNFIKLIAEIAAEVSGPISAEVAGLDYADMIKEGRILANIAKNIVVKIPLTYDGLRACKTLTDEGVPVNVTLCFAASQALLAAKAGATYISPFIGRLDDISHNGLALISETKAIYNNYPALKTRILAASIRNPLHFVESAKSGADVATIPPRLFKQLLHHPLTDKGVEQFKEDWEKTGQTIL